MAVAESIEDVLLKRLRAVEQEQIDLLQLVVDVMRHAHAGNHAMCVESLAQVVGMSYLMAHELGIPPERLDREVVLALEGMPVDPERDRQKAAEDIIQYLKSRWEGRRRDA
ncbi:MazG-like family protein [Alicyclobacillus vulcanalis]|nr:MazG-like family protein [Alicyclobacillus vulcanalis]